MSARLAALALGATLIAGCGSWWPWSSSAPSLPDPPAPTTTVAARLAWSAKVPAGGVGFAPVVANGAVFVASADGTISRLDPANGRLVWQVNAGKRLSAGPGSDGDIVVVAARDGTLVAVSADGKPLWSTSMGADAASVPAVGLGVVVLRTSDNRISGYDLDTGKRRWTVSRQLPPLVLRQTTSVAIAPGTVFAGLPGGRLIAVGLQNGALRWEASVSNPRGANEIERIADVMGTPLVSGREVCAGSFQGKLACFDAPSGRTLWARDVSTAGGIEIDARLVSASDEKGQVHAFSRSGASVWKQDKLLRRDPSAPLSVGNVLLVGDVQGYVYLLSRDDGAIAARFASDGTPVVSQGVVQDRTAIVQTSGGTVLAITVD